MKDTSNKKMHEQNQTELELIGGSFSPDNEIETIREDLALKEANRKIYIEEAQKNKEEARRKQKKAILNKFQANLKLEKSNISDKDILEILSLYSIEDKDEISAFKKLNIRHQFGLLCVQASHDKHTFYNFQETLRVQTETDSFLSPDSIITDSIAESFHYEIRFDDDFRLIWLEFVNRFNWIDSYNREIDLYRDGLETSNHYTPYDFSSIEVLNKHLKKILSGKFIPLGGYPWVYWKNSEFVLTIAENNLDHLINCAPPHFHKNKELHLKILAKYPEYYFKMKNRNLKKDKEIIKVTVRTKPELLKKMVETNFKFFQKFNPFTLTTLIEKTGKKIKNFDSFFEKIWHERYK